MSMSKKDYIAIAAAIKSQLSVWQYGTTRHDQGEVDGAKAAVENLAFDITDYCAADNPRFNRQRFLAACGVQS